VTTSAGMTPSTVIGVSAILRFAVAASIAAWATGCAPSVRSLSASLLGCMPSEVEISDVVYDYASKRWTARCGGHEYSCSESRTGAPVRVGAGAGATQTDSAACTEAATAAPASAGAPPAAGSNGAEPPRGAAGFTFGADTGSVEQVCRAAGLAWKAEADDRFSCSGAPTDVGFPVATSGKLCGGKLCSISIDGARDATWAQLVERFARLRSSLTAKYGSPAAQATGRLADCTDDVSACFERGRIKTDAAWRWRTGEALDLVLDGGAAAARPHLWVVYGTAAGVPRARGAVDAATVGGTTTQSASPGG